MSKEEYLEDIYKSDSENSVNFFSDEEDYLNYKEEELENIKEKHDLMQLDNLIFINDQLLEYVIRHGLPFLNIQSYSSYYLFEFLKSFYSHFK